MRRSASPIRPSSSSTHFLSGFSPAIESGRRTFSSAVSMGSRLKNWKMKPMCRRRSLVRSESFSLEMAVPSIVTSPEVGLSRPARIVHQGRLAGARRAHHGGQLTLGHVEGDASKRVDGGVAFAVAARQVGRGDDRPRVGSLPSRCCCHLHGSCPCVAHLSSMSLRQVFTVAAEVSRRLTGGCGVRLAAQGTPSGRRRTRTRPRGRRKRRSAVLPPSGARGRHGSRSRRTAPPRRWRSARWAGRPARAGARSRRTRG